MDEPILLTKAMAMRVLGIDEAAYDKLRMPQAVEPRIFLRIDEVIRRSGLGKSTIYALMKKGEFPACVSLGPRCVAWVESELEEWQARRLSSRASASQENPPTPA